MAGIMKKIPDDVLCDISECGGLSGLIGSLPTKNRLDRLAIHHLVLSDRVRLQILLTLSKITICVCVLKKLTRCPDTRLSYHLSALKKAGFIISRRERSYLNYSLTAKGKLAVSWILTELE